MLYGAQDQLADSIDVAWTRDQIDKDRKNVVFYKEYLLGHMSFLIARDMSFFTEDVVAVVNHYNKKCSWDTLGSNFVEGNEKCLEELRNHEDPDSLDDPPSFSQQFVM
mmetsp:Transcript_15426/g.26089  ORF Transcript_15426/g.26089 Transcript_15426/m.26089 type:complete len:108 (+) Transcript_15426:1104-1427(+)